MLSLLSANPASSAYLVADCSVEMERLLIQMDDTGC